MPAPLPILNGGCKPGCSCQDSESRPFAAVPTGFHGEHGGHAPSAGATPPAPAGADRGTKAGNPHGATTAKASPNGEPAAPELRLSAPKANSGPAEPAAPNVRRAIAARKPSSPGACKCTPRPTQEARSPTPAPGAARAEASSASPPVPADAGASFHEEREPRETGRHAASEPDAADDRPTFHVEHDRQLATLGSLVASIAHEINNILTPIASYADLARMHPGDEELTAKALQRAAAGARQASEIATAILSLATPQRGETPAQCDDLRDIINRATLCLGSEPARLGVKVAWEAPQGVALAMPAVALQHVLVNLLINALRASKRGGIVEVAAAVGGPEGAADGSTKGRPRSTSRSNRPDGADGSTWNQVEITVRDAGEGIPPARQGGIFRDFESGCGSTGLGLAICKRLLEKWGGAIRLAETGPGGTVFAVAAPLASAEKKSAA